jgi:hypothetical protein
VFVVVTVVRGVPVAVMDIVQVVAVQDRRVATSFTVYVVVRLRLRVGLGSALVVVIVVTHVHMAVVEIFDVPVVLLLDVAAVRAVNVIVVLGDRVDIRWAFVIVPVMSVVLMPVVHIVEVSLVFHGDVPTVHPVNVGVLFMNRMINGSGHVCPLSMSRPIPRTRLELHGCCGRRRCVMGQRNCGPIVMITAYWVHMF